jgi:hypothetical protein
MTPELRLALNRVRRRTQGCEQRCPHLPREVGGDVGLLGTLSIISYHMTMSKI